MTLLRGFKWEAFHIHRKMDDHQIVHIVPDIKFLLFGETCGSLPRLQLNQPSQCSRLTACGVSLLDARKGESRWSTQRRTWWSVREE